jgi:hypothetical protein
MRKAIIFLAMTSSMTACADLTPTQQRALTGTAIGAGGGAVLGAIGGNAALGAVAGAGAGLATGLVVDRVRQNEAAAYQRGVASGRQSSN